MEDLDEESRAKRKKEQVEFRTKKRTSNTFMFFATIFEIIETLILMIVLFISFAFIIFRVLKLGDSQIGVTIFEIGSLIIFIGGMILGFLIYKKVVRIAIKKMHLEDKLSDEVLNHYIKNTKEEMEEELKK